MSQPLFNHWIVRMSVSCVLPSRLIVCVNKSVCAECRTVPQTRPCSCRHTAGSSPRQHHCCWWRGCSPWGYCHLEDTETHTSIFRLDHKDKSRARNARARHELLRVKIILLCANNNFQEKTGFYLFITLSLKQRKTHSNQRTSARRGGEACRLHKAPTVRNSEKQNHN